MSMKIYLVADDWTSKVEYYDDFDAALARQKERFDEFWTTQREWHAGNVKIEDFYVEEHDLNVKG